LAQGLPDETAALLFLDGQYALRHRDPANGIQIKMLAPESVRAAFSRIPVDSGWLPPDVRRWGHTPNGAYAVMFVPAQKHRLRLDNTWGDRFPHKRSLKIEVPLPPMVFVGIGTHYGVLACAGEPAPEAPAYLAPLPNVGSTGGICFGDNPHPPAGPGTLAQAWKVFMTSPFNDHQKGGASRQYPDDVREQLMALAEQGADIYPVEDLIRHGRNTVASAVNQMLGLGGAL
jgi:hypothetical protein